MLTRNTLAVAMRHALAVSATALIVSSPAAFAQSTGGSVFGQAASGDTVIVEGDGTGFRREISVGADGSYRVPALSPGKYQSHVDVIQMGRPRSATVCRSVRGPVRR